ncbi:MAG: hypothetical protein HY084_03820 [Gemmatimonadetes bacterium]|nr:hypothetical protein [Gemmatimonadota bacterium]
MTSPFTAVLGSLIRHRGVSGCLVVGERDGMIVEANLQIGVKGDAIAALSASLYRKARRSALAAGFGEAGFFELTADGGRVCAVGRNELVLVVIGEPGVNVGIIRVEMLRALELFQ